MRINIRLWLGDLRSSRSSIRFHERTFCIFERYDQRQHASQVQAVRYFLIVHDDLRDSDNDDEFAKSRGKPRFRVKKGRFGLQKVDNCPYF